MAERFTDWINGASTKTLDGTEKIPLVSTNTQQNTLANIGAYIGANYSSGLTWIDLYSSSGTSGALTVDSNALPSGGNYMVAFYFANSSTHSEVFTITLSWTDGHSQTKSKVFTLNAGTLNEVDSVFVMQNWGGHIHIVIATTSSGATYDFNLQCI